MPDLQSEALRVTDRGPVFNMVVECTDRYSFETNNDGSAEISIRVPARFRDLWLVRLSDLTTTPEEIAEHGR
jgi:hypothetical protein